MVFETQSAFLLKVIVIFAFLAAFFGLWVINALFRNRLKELFSDAQFFIFFFMVFGYSLYALGEVTWFLIYELFELYSLSGMADFYWVIGSLLMLIPLTALSRRLYRTYSSFQKAIPLLLSGAVLLFLIFFYVSAMGGSAIEYYYAVSNSLLLLASAPLLLFFWQLKAAQLFEANLVYLFFGNMGFFIAELLYIYITPREIYGSLGVLADSMYALGYFLSAFAFMMLLIKFYSSSRKQAVA